MTSIKRRAAIVTPYGLFNYGNRLQNIAVDATLKAHGFEVETLILKQQYPLPVFRDIAKNLAHQLGLGGVASRKYKSFHDFNRSIRARRIWGPRHLARTAKKYDAVVCGSDQIWNPHQVNFNGAEYANFAEDSRRIAISPSFGVGELPRELRAAVGAELSEFHSLSAREFSGAQIVRDLVGKEVPVLIDPTMSIDASTWRAKSDDRMVPRVPYLFVYLLGKHDPETWRQIEILATARGLKVVTLMRKDRPEFYSAGPQDFLSLIDNATTVVTDSFHSLVFSMLFDTEALLVARNDSHSMSSRFSTLQKHFDFVLSPHEEFVGANRVVLDGSKFDSRLNELKAEYLKYVEAALSSL